MHNRKLASHVRMAILSGLWLQMCLVVRIEPNKEDLANGFLVRIFEKYNPEAVLIRVFWDETTNSYKLYTAQGWKFEQAKNPIQVVRKVRRILSQMNYSVHFMEKEVPPSKEFLETSVIQEALEDDIHHAGKVFTTLLKIYKSLKAKKEPKKEFQELLTALRKLR